MTTTLIFTIPDGETFQSFSQLNNILIVTTDQNRYFLMWDYNEEEYVELEDIPTPLVNFVEYSISNVATSETYDMEGSYGYPVDRETMTKAMNIYYDNVIASNLPSGKLRGRVILRLAYKLKDGSYIKQSQLHYFQTTLDVGDDKFGLYRKTDITGTADAAFMNIRFCDDFRMYYKFTTEQKNILEAYKNVIESIDVFMTYPVDHYDQNANLDWDDWPFESGSYYGIYDYRYFPDGFKDSVVIEQINYYFIHSIDINSILSNPESNAEIDLGNITQLQTGDTLPVDNFTHHSVWGQSHYNYNSRLHFGNVKTKLFGGFNPFYWQYNEASQSTHNYAIKVYIRTDQGDKIVTKYFNTPYKSGSPLIERWNNILSYPDSRAYKLEVLVYSSGVYKTGNITGDPDSISIFDLTPHPFLNFSYVIISLDENIDADEYFEDLSSEQDMTVSNILLDINRVQVSRLDNALVYPAENSYQIGNDDESIISFGSVVEPLSDGQFGQFPLYVFTTAGIFVLEQGSGSILYSNVLPLNKEVCNNALSITDIGGGVVFSTERGLKILSGRNVIEISQNIEGIPLQHLIDNDTYQSYLNDPFFVRLLSDLSTVGFLTYIENAIIGYDFNNKEIIVSNDSYTYSYAFNLENNTWHKINEVFAEMVALIPDTLGYRDGILYDIKDEENEYIETLLQTRPIKLDSLNRKSIERLVLRGIFDVKDLTYSGLHLFGSVDGKNYVYLRGKTPQDDNTFNDILIKRTHANFEFLIVVFAAQLKNSSINFIETDYFERWAKKLR